MIEQPRGVFGGHLHHLGDQQRLRGDARLGHLRLEPLVDKPLVRGVLIDDDHAMGGLRDDVVLVDLRPRGAQWPVLGQRLGQGLDPGGGREAGCVLGQTGWRLQGVGRAPRRRTGPLGQPGPRALGPEGPQRRARHGARRPVPRSGQRMAQRREDQPAHHPRLAKPDLGLGGMHVHVHPLGRTVQKQRRRRVPALRQQIRVGRAQRAKQQLVAHRASVDEEKLRHRSAARIGRQRGETRQPQPVAFGIDAQRVFGELRSEDAPHPPR